MASRNIPLKFSTMRDGIELFKAQESFKGSNLELYIDTQYLIESKEKRIKSLDEDDRDELFALWVQKGYIDHNYAGIKKTFRDKLLRNYKLVIRGHKLNSRYKADYCLTTAFPQCKPVKEDGNIMLTIVKENFKLKDDIKMLRDEVKSKSEEVGILEDNLKAKDEIIRKKEDYFCELQSELERLKTENEMKIIRIKELTNIISATNKEYQTLSIKKDEIMEENTEQNQETKNLNIKLDNKNLKSNKQKLHQLQEEIKVIGNSNKLVKTWKRKAEKQPEEVLKTPEKIRKLSNSSSSNMIHVKEMNSDNIINGDLYEKNE